MRCRTKGPVSLSFYKRASSLPPDWNELLPAGHFLLSESLDLYESACLPDVTFLYVIAADTDGIVAAASFQVLNIRHYHLAEDRMPPVLKYLWRSSVRIFSPKLLVCGHLFRHDISNFYARPGIENFDAFNVYKQCINGALRHTCAHTVLVKDTPAPFVNYVTNHLPGYMLLRNDISMEMEIPETWRSMEDYERSLKHKYAQRFRKIRAAFEPVTIRELTVDDVWQRMDDIYALYRQVSDHQPARLGFLSREILPLLKQRHDELKVWGMYEHDRLIAFASAWTRDRNFDMFYIGFDYERNQELQLYFNILFFSLEQAIAFNKRQLILGRTALEAKARAGCRPRYLHTFLYIRNSVFRSFVNRMRLKVQDSEGEWENRHPLKN